MVVGFTTTCVISTYHHWNCEFEPRSWRGILDTTLCDRVCQWLSTGLWFSPGSPVSSTNKTDCYDITEIWLKMVLQHLKPKLELLTFMDVKKGDKKGPNFQTWLHLVTGQIVI
jgi:hypothetical protein